MVEDVYTDVFALYCDNLDRSRLRLNTCSQCACPVFQGDFMRLLERMQRIRDIVQRVQELVQSQNSDRKVFLTACAPFVKGHSVINCWVLTDVCTYSNPFCIADKSSKQKKKKL